MLSVLILFNDPRIDSVFTKQGVVWLHTVLQTRFTMMSDDGNGLNMLDATRYSLDPCIRFITHLPLSSEVCPFFFKCSILLPLIFFIFFTCKLTRSPYFLPATHPSSPISLKSSLLYMYIYIYIFQTSHPTPSIFPSSSILPTSKPPPTPPKKRDFFPP